jgi:hypothetical protein
MFYIENDIRLSVSEIFLKADEMLKMYQETLQILQAYALKHSSLPVQKKLLKETHEKNTSIGNDSDFLHDEIDKMLCNNPSSKCGQVCKNYKKSLQISFCYDTISSSVQIEFHGDWIIFGKREFLIEKNPRGLERIQTILMDMYSMLQSENENQPDIIHDSEIFGTLPVGKNTITMKRTRVPHSSGIQNMIKDSINNVEEIVIYEQKQGNISVFSNSTKISCSKESCVSSECGVVQKARCYERSLNFCRTASDRTHHGSIQKIAATEKGKTPDKNKRLLKRKMLSSNIYVTCKNSNIPVRVNTSLFPGNIEAE